MYRCALRSSLASLLFSLLATASPAAVITDGVLTVTVTETGRFHQVSLNGVEVEPGLIVQQQFASGWAFESVSGVTVSGDGASASYTALAHDDELLIEVTTTLLGPLASSPGDTGVIQQTLEFTNLSAFSLGLTSNAFIDPDLEGTGGNFGETVDFDPATHAVFTHDAPMFMAAIADETGGVLGWEIGGSGLVSLDYSGFSNNSGPIGPTSVDMAIGLDAGPLAPLANHTMAFRYLFATGGQTQVPSEFSFVPEPSSAALLGAALSVLAAHRRRH